MRVLIAPNTFKDCLGAREVAQTMAAGVLHADPSAQVSVLPLSDGGDGLIDVLQGLVGFEVCQATSLDPIERPLQGRFLLNNQRQLAVVEMAEASGLRHLLPAERNPRHATTRGTGMLIRAALDAGARTILVGVGGSATMEGGAGALAALGARFLDAAGRELRPAPDELVQLADVDLSGLDPRLATIELQLLCDVATPLAASQAVFGGQKGARPEDADLYCRAYDALVHCAAARGFAWRETPNLGAGGGFSGGLAIFAAGKVRPGAEAVAELLQLEPEIAAADLVLTGEGRLDVSSLAGKLPLYVARLCARLNKPSVILTGQLGPGVCAELPQRCSAFAVLDGPATLDQALGEARAGLERQSWQVLRLFQASGPH